MGDPFASHMAGRLRPVLTSWARLPSRGRLRPALEMYPLHHPCTRAGLLNSHVTQLSR